MIQAQQQPSFHLLQSAYLQNRLSHAYLLSGMPGLGKIDFAKSFAEYVLCKNNRSAGASLRVMDCATTFSCGTCHYCLLMKAGNHPDFILIKPEEKSHVIKIDQIREMSDRVSRTTHAGGYQIVVIAPADAMPVQAANALLKTLEEPSENIIIFLIDDQKSVLPATIISRCQKIFFSNDHIDLRVQNNTLMLRDQLLNHLEKIIDHKINSITLNPIWFKIKLEDIFQQLFLIFSDISRIQFHVSKKYIINHDCYETLSKLASKISPEKLQSFIEKLLEKKLFISKGIHLNQQLCLEDIFIAWEKCCS